jgi:hypothetical protein
MDADKVLETGRLFCLHSPAAYRTRNPPRTVQHIQSPRFSFVQIDGRSKLHELYKVETGYTVWEPPRHISSLEAVRNIRHICIDHDPQNNILLKKRLPY